jgi:hypothetical protein
VTRFSLDEKDYFKFFPQHAVKDKSAQALA